MFIEAQHFFYELVRGKTYQPSIPVVNYTSLSTTEILRILTSFKVLGSDLFLEEFRKASDIIYNRLTRLSLLETTLVLRCLSEYTTLMDYDEPLELGLSEPFDPINLYEYMRRIFKNYDQISNVDIVPDDLITLNELDDSALRRKIAQIINGADPNVILREATKPHTPAEIADMEIPITIDWDRIFLCIPFKSGREISENSVPASVGYQLIRPFLDFSFSSCIVVFITAKKCSQYLMNFIKKCKAKD